MAAGSILVFHVWRYSAPNRASVDFGPAGWFLPDLSFGVVLFFTLSGFLLYTPFVAAILRGGRGSDVRRYYRNRFLRIVPAYVVILLVCALVLQSVLLPGGGNGALHDPWALLLSALFLQNYHPDTILVGIGPAWSLNVEVVFYLVLPVLAFGALALASRIGRLTAALLPVVALLGLGLSGKAIAAYAVPPTSPFNGYAYDWHSVVERSFVCHADLFAFGMALAVFRTLWVDGRVRLPAGWRAPTAIFSGLTLLAVAAFATNNGEHLSYSPWNTVVALDLALVLALVVLVDPRRGPVAASGAIARVATALRRRRRLLQRLPLARAAHPLPPGTWIDVRGTRRFSREPRAHGGDHAAPLVRDLPSGRGSGASAQVAGAGERGRGRGRVGVADDH